MVLNIIAINDDAKNIIPNDYKNKDFKEVVDSIASLLIENSIINKSVSILVNTSGSISDEEVESLLTTSFEEKEIDVTIIKQNISDEVKNDADKYNISESKASYIKDIIRGKDNLSFEDLKDKSIEELNEIKNKKEDLNTNTTKENNNNTQTTTTPKKSVSTTSQPSDPTKEIDKWCAYNKNGNPYGHEKPMMLNSYDVSSKMETYVMQKYNIASTEEFLARGATTSNEDKRSSYCVSYVVTFVTRNWYKVFYVDSVKGDVIEEQTKAVPKFIDLMEARNIALKHVGITSDDCWDYAPGEVRLYLDGMGGNEVYKYSVHLALKQGTDKFVIINAITGTVIG